MKQRFFTRSIISIISMIITPAAYGAAIVSPIAGLRNPAAYTQNLVSTNPNLPCQGACQAALLNTRILANISTDGMVNDTLVQNAPESASDKLYKLVPVAGAGHQLVPVDENPRDPRISNQTAKGQIQPLPTYDSNFYMPPAPADVMAMPADLGVLPMPADIGLNGASTGAAMPVL